MIVAILSSHGGAQNGVGYPAGHAHGPGRQEAAIRHLCSTSHTMTYLTCQSQLYVPGVSQ
jgi:hypothetical protein